MADNNKARSAPGGNSEEIGAFEGADEDDQGSEHAECVEEMVFQQLVAPPENQWYHGRLDRRIAEKRLNDRQQLGDYLIRESESKPGSYVLSYFGKTGINHFRITAMSGDFYIGGRQFDTLSDLIGYYTKISYLLKGEQLVTPVPPPEPVDDRRKVIAIFPYCKMHDTDELSFEKGDIFVVNNEMGDGWLWVWSQRTGEEGQVYEELVEDLNGNLDPVESLPYFHPKITKDEAVSKLRQAGPNSFLVRSSDNSPGNYTLFFLCKQTVQRFKIEKVGRQLIMGGRYFDDMGSIISRYKKEEIVEGHTLNTPVTRPKTDMPEKFPLLAKLEHQSSAEDIYASIRLSTGPNRLMGRKDRIECIGYLQKRSNKSKKWKSFYFILNGSNRELCFFENEKRSKSKGLIDLNYSELYPVDDSFFGRPNCFQLVTNALQDYQIYYLCAENADLATSWINVLKEHCVNTQMTRIQKRSTVLKELRSLSVEVIECRNIPTKYLSHPFCVITLNSVKVCRTRDVDTTNLFWQEDFTLDDIPGDVRYISVKIFNHSKRSKDTEVAHITIPLVEFDNGELIDKWYTLQPHAAVRCDMGSIRLRTRYIHQVIMPEEQYTSLKDLILNDFGNILTLAEVCGNHRVSLAKALLNLFRHERQVQVLLKNINDYYIAKEDEVSTLFRGSTLATTLMDQYMKMIGTEFVHAAIKGPVCKICESKQSCELNKQFLDNPSELPSNTDHFVDFLTEMVESIFKSTESCPKVLRYICGRLQKTVSAKWPEDESVRTRVVSGFVFLRLLCPAILHPKSFNLITETPSETAVRTLKLIAKALQNLANLVEFGVKEQFMTCVNPFIKNNKARMVEFLDKLSNVSECVEIHDNAIGDLSRDLATIHQICATHVEDLRKRSDSQVCH
ncbi:ras GTPase-activating protein 1-like [Mercenaria mercenaria]|uniref:ras GTPase-activating protein 1-like n=1 Tax=Mercenaria mercenaria TaxID=6596 RepID=UPI00234F9EA0|nr:ras GTPase-activating protein 1-like [Mercenaria mercenaria]